MCRLVGMVGDKVLGFQGSHAAASGSSDGLAVLFVLDIAGSKDAGDAGDC